MKTNKQPRLDLYLEETSNPKNKDLHILIPITTEEIKILLKDDKAYKAFKKRNEGTF